MQNGTWRSLVARLTGGQEVASSNLVVPTAESLSSKEVRLFLLGSEDAQDFHCFHLIPYYELLQEMVRGGFGVFYKAWQTGAVSAAVLVSLTILTTTSSWML